MILVNNFIKSGGSVLSRMFSMSQDQGNVTNYNYNRVDSFAIPASKLVNCGYDCVAGNLLEVEFVDFPEVVRIGS